MGSVTLNPVDCLKLVNSDTVGAETKAISAAGLALFNTSEAIEVGDGVLSSEARAILLKLSFEISKLVYESEGS